MYENVKNLDAAKELVKTYESVTLENIKDNYYDALPFDGGRIASHITNFGTVGCSLCESIRDLYNTKCRLCIYLKPHACYGYENEDTYFAIDKAKTPEELLKAFKDRAEHIKEIIKKIEDD